jgi:hypothetical protein
MKNKRYIHMNYTEMKEVFKSTPAYLREGVANEICFAISLNSIPFSVQRELQFDENDVARAMREIREEETA